MDHIGIDVHKRESQIYIPAEISSLAPLLHAPVRH
jgi:hypothetical protein